MHDLSTWNQFSNVSQNGFRWSRLAEIFTTNVALFKKRPRKSRRGRSAKPFSPSKSKGLKTNPFSTRSKVDSPSPKRKKDSTALQGKSDLDTADDLEDEEEEESNEPQTVETDPTENDTSSSAGDEEESDTEEND